MPIEMDALTELLEQLAETGKPSSVARLYLLSDLSGDDLAEFCAAWDTYETPQRRRLLHWLDDLAESNFEVNFDAIFLQALSDPDEEVRATAIDGLWENEGVGLIGPLLNMLRADPSPRVRASAATGLGRFVLAGELEEIEAPVHNRIMTELLTVLHLAGESVEVRRRAVEAVAYACNPEVSEALELAYYDEDEGMRMSAVVGMGRSCDKRWKNVILRELHSTSPAMRYEAAWACGELSLHQAVPALAQLIHDPDRQVDEAAIWALGQIGGPEARQVLLEAYDDADEDTAVSIDEALAEQALLEGEIDFLLYDLEEESTEGWPEDEFITLWASEEDDAGDVEGEDGLEDEDDFEDDWEP
jgi:HEAT repeat protein